MKAVARYSVHVCVNQSLRSCAMGNRLVVAVCQCISAVFYAYKHPSLLVCSILDSERNIHKTITQIQVTHVIIQKLHTEICQVHDHACVLRRRNLLYLCATVSSQGEV